MFSRSWPRAKTRPGREANIRSSLNSLTLSLRGMPSAVASKRVSFMRSGPQRTISSWRSSAGGTADSRALPSALARRRTARMRAVSSLGMKGLTT